MKAGPQPGGGFVLPDGRRIKPVGREVLFEEPDLLGTFPMSIFPVPGTRLALVSDGGIRDNVLRVLDLDALAGGGAPVKSYIPFPRPSSLYYGLAWLPPNRALASGGGDAKVYAFDVDPVTGQAARAEARDIDLGMAGQNPWYSGAIALSGDGKRLVVGPSQYAEQFQVISLEDADYGTRLATISSSGSHAIFDVRLDPFDPLGITFYATDQSASRLLEIEIGKDTPTRVIPLAKSPAQLAFLDETYLVVAEAHGDSIAIVNRATGAVDARVPVFEEDSPRGLAPSALTYDAANKRLYATLAGINAVEVFDVGAGAPPTITPAGRISTGWWPTGVMVDADGSLAVISGKGHGTGPDEVEGAGEITSSCTAASSTCPRTNSTTSPRTRRSSRRAASSANCPAAPPSSAPRAPTISRSQRRSASLRGKSSTSSSWCAKTRRTTRSWATGPISATAIPA